MHPLDSPATAARPGWWRGLWQRWLLGGAGGPKPAPRLLPIRRLRPRHRSRIEAHLLSLDPRDRYLRFGYLATDEQIVRYAGSLDFARDEVLGVFDRRLRLIAMAHVAFSRDQRQRRCAEFGVSVSAQARGRGFGGRLFARAVLLARNAGVGLFFIHALSENTAMLRIARRAGATVQRDGSDTEAYLALPPAGLDTRVGQLVQDRFAEVDYGLKREARQFRHALRDLQEIRQGVRDGRHRSGQ
jgi:RimJ/RimL family protein N-acetyltransferase